MIMYARAKCSNKHASARKTSPRGAAAGGRSELSFQEREKEEPRLARSNFTVACPLCMWSGEGQLASSLIKVRES